MVESTSLLTRQGLKALEGSNPFVSASTKNNAFALFLFVRARDERIRKTEAVYKTNDSEGLEGLKQSGRLF
ncbi:MAG: hypothetical protein RLZZ480_709 [Candidatus Parcubacteria bacterium]